MNKMDQPIIDCHMHIYGSKKEGQLNKEGYQIWEYGMKPKVRFSKYDGDLDDALQAIHKSGISRAIVVNLFAVDRARRNAIAQLASGLSRGEKEERIRHIDASIGQMLKDSNIRICKMARKHGELIPFIAVDPWALRPEESEHHLRDMVMRHGAKGIKLHPVLQRFFPTDRRMWPIYEACVELDIPILSHSGLARTQEQYAEPRAFTEILQAFPKLRLVLAHLGGGSWRQTLETARRYPNLYFDCSEIMEWADAPGAPTTQQLARLIKDVGPERVMMGTDFPWYDIDHGVELVMAYPILSYEEKCGILGANAQQIIGA